MRAATLRALALAAVEEVDAGRPARALEILQSVLVVDSLPVPASERAEAPVAPLRGLVTRPELAVLLGCSARHVVNVEHTFPRGSVVRLGRTVRYRAEVILDALGDGAREQPPSSEQLSEGAAWLAQRRRLRVVRGNRT